MTAETIASNFSIDMNSAISALKVSGLKAAEAIEAGEAVYIDSDGELALAVTTQSVVGDVPDYIGFAAHDAAIGEPVTVFGAGVRMTYGASLTPGEFLAICATAGKLEPSTTTGLLVAVAISATEILAIPPIFVPVIA